MIARTTESEQRKSDTKRQQKEEEQRSSEHTHTNSAKMLRIIRTSDGDGDGDKHTNCNFAWKLPKTARSLIIALIRIDNLLLPSKFTHERLKSDPTKRIRRYGSTPSTLYLYFFVYLTVRFKFCAYSEELAG